MSYDDCFSEDTEKYFERSNQKDELGNRLVANTEANGRFHSDWLTMICSRLRLSRNLLDDDGVICVSISDIELGNIRSLLNEIFGEDNYINTISVVAKVAAGASGGGEDKRLKKNIEYILIYAKHFDAFNTLTHLYTERSLIDVINGMKDAGGSWKYTSILLGAEPREHICTIKDGDGNPIEIYKRNGVSRTTINKVCKDEGIDEEVAYKKYFAKIFSDTNAQTSIRTRVIDAVESLDSNEILEVEYVPRSGRDKGKLVTHSYISNTVRRVIWLHEVADTSGENIIKKEKLGTLWSDFDYNNVGKEGGIPFPDGKKPIDLIRWCIRLYKNNDGIFMDYFAGSCSLAHAVIRENILTGGARRFIAIQLSEDIDTKNKKYAAALRFYEDNNIAANVAEIGKERIRRAGKIIKEDSADKEGIDKLDIGFRVLKVDSSNMKEVYYTPDVLNKEDLFSHSDNVREDRTAEDLLFQVLLDWGVDLALPIQQEMIDEKTVYFVDEDALAACFDTGINEDFIKQLATRKPLRVVFRDAGFENDSVKINIEQIFKLMSPSTEVKTI